jgi:ABC-type amino acid transport substrate-binding protein
MKKIAILLICTLIIGATACTTPPDEPTEPHEHAELGFVGRNIGIITDTLCYFTAKTIGANPINYTDSATAVEDINSGKIAGYMNALSVVRVMAAELGDKFKAVEIPAEIFKAEIGGITHDEIMLHGFNNYLNGITINGTLDEIKERWFGDSLDLTAPMPEIGNFGEHGVLRVATTSDAVPYAYLDNGEWKGFSVELALRFGAYIEKSVEFVDIKFNELIDYVAQENADISFANMVITDERAELIMFTNPIVAEQHGILMLR